VKVLYSQAFASPHLWGLSHLRSLRRRLHARHHGVCPDSWLPKEGRRRWHSQKLLIFMRFHGVFLGSQHAMWPKQPNGKVRLVLRRWSKPTPGIRRKQRGVTRSCRACRRARPACRSSMVCVCRRCRSGPCGVRRGGPRKVGHHTLSTT